MRTFGQTLTARADMLDVRRFQRMLALGLTTPAAPLRPPADREESQ